MEAHRRPPAEISPDEFFSTWLPAELARLGGLPSDSVMVRVTLEGEEGGSWDLTGGGGRFQVHPADHARSAPIALWLGVPDWRAIVSGEAGLAPPEVSVTDLLFIDSSSRRLTRTSGTYRFEVTGYRGRTWCLTVVVNTPERSVPPTATISIDAVSYGRILSRELSPAEAYYAHRIAVTGDLALGIQVGLALLPKVR